MSSRQELRSNSGSCLPPPPSRPGGKGPAVGAKVRVSGGSGLSSRHPLPQPGHPDRHWGRVMPPCWGPAPFANLTQRPGRGEPSARASSKVGAWHRPPGHLLGWGCRGAPGVGQDSHPGSRWGGRCRPGSAGSEAGLGGPLSGRRPSSQSPLATPPGSVLLRKGALPLLPPSRCQQFRGAARGVGGAGSV